MDDEDAELRNPFPSPPSHYTRYTAHNLNLLQLLNERAPDDPNPIQQEVLSDQIEIPEWPLKSLEKPRVDWILEEPDAHFTVFGDIWHVKEKVASLAELGGTQLYPSDPSVDRRPALLSILKSLLVSYTQLTSSLLAPPPTNSVGELPPQWYTHSEWLTVLSQNLMSAANDLRPVQARGNLESMMKRQIELRREETDVLHKKCDTLEGKLAELRQAAQTAFTTEDEPSEARPLGTPITAAPNSQNPTASAGGVTNDDVLRWAEEL
ncbi:hypothetical protein CYLTODRAFT_426451 [Cylindrobasidium torrendii FP15055 ss-10]|uniref:Mediator of RNA polymerase II transcription subunit 7 n=1 Tax=Cylindrobasidium torrendii FP15055 ss-10 TaxID=1314674 RepID=A0A0D7AYG8_9AGAR|nr:hypothetical protein CYLTODRAFT_426451 [Cylindrobasidium torrendii FP15055 ss-10]